jgi:hypothetical protein
VRGRFTVALLASLLFLHCECAGASPGDDDSIHGDKVALRYLWWPFKSERKGGRIYYGVSECKGLRWETPFPEVLIRKPPKDISDIATLRAFFAKDARVRISDSNGIIRIRFGEIPAAILQTKIALINLSPEDQYNPELAISKIEYAPEVQAAMTASRVHVPSWPTNMILQRPAPGLIHLQPVMKDISMDEALDVVATTFNGVVETGYCKKSKMMDSDVTGYDRN